MAIIKKKEGMNLNGSRGCGKNWKEGHRGNGANTLYICKIFSDEACKKNPSNLQSFFPSVFFPGVHFLRDTTRERENESQCANPGMGAHAPMY